MIGNVGSSQFPLHYVCILKGRTTQAQSPSFTFMVLYSRRLLLWFDGMGETCKTTFFIILQRNLCQIWFSSCYSYVVWLLSINWVECVNWQRSTKIESLWMHLKCFSIIFINIAENALESFQKAFQIFKYIFLQLFRIFPKIFASFSQPLKNFYIFYKFSQKLLWKLEKKSMKFLQLSTKVFLFFFFLKFFPKFFPITLWKVALISFLASKTFGTLLQNLFKFF